jgi:hypothetical protein
MTSHEVHAWRPGCLKVQFSDQMAFRPAVTGGLAFSGYVNGITVKQST